MGFLRLTKIITGPPDTSGVTGRALTNIISEAGIFKNYVDSMVSWGSTGGYDPTKYNADGYPINGTIAVTIGGEMKFESTLVPTDVMVVAWTGTFSNPSGSAAGVRLGRGAPGFASIVDTGSFVKAGSGAFNLYLEGTNGYVEFQFATSVPASISYVFDGGSTYNNLTRVIVCRKVDYTSLVAAYAAGNADNLVRDDWVALYHTANFKVVRFMGPVLGPNQDSNVTQIGYIPAWRTSMLNNNDWVPPAVWAGSDTTNTNNYVVVKPPDSSAFSSYQDGETIVCRITHANTGTVTLDSGSRGAKAVVRNNYPVLIALSAGDIDGTSASGLCTFVYNSILDKFIYRRGAIASLLPYELQCAICNRINAHLWTNFPFYIADAGVTAIAQVVRDKLGTGKMAYFEYSNEVWNNDYAQTPSSTAMATALGLTGGGDDRQPWYGFRIRFIAQLVNNAWSPRPSAQCKPVIAVQCVATPTTSAVSYMDRMAGRFLAPAGTGVGGAGKGNSVYVTYCAARTSYTGTSDFTQMGQRPIDHCKVIAPAPYWSQSHAFQYPGQYIQSFGAMGSTGKAITGISKATTCRVTSPAHGFTSGARVLFDNTIVGMTQLNDTTASITVFDANNYDLYSDYARTVPINSTGFGTWTSGGNAKVCPDIAVYVQACIDYDAGNAATAFGNWDNDILTGTNNPAGEPNNFALSFFNNTTSTSPFKGWDALAGTIEGQGHGPITVENYEGGYSTVPPDIAGAYQLGCTVSGTVTMNNNSSPRAVNWTSHPFKNGSRVGFVSSGGTLPPELRTLDITIAAIGGGAATGYYVVNSTTSGFDISPAYGGPPIVLTSAGTGTITCTGHKYIFDKMLWDYKLSTNFYNIILRQFRQNIGTSLGDANFGLLPHSVLPDVFMVVGPNAWSASTGDSFAPKFKSWDAASDYNNSLVSP